MCGKRYADVGLIQSIVDFIGNLQFRGIGFCVALNPNTGNKIKRKIGHIQELHGRLRVLDYRIDLLHGIQDDTPDLFWIRSVLYPKIDVHTDSKVRNGEILDLCIS